MNQVLIDSWNFFKNNTKELFTFMLPVFALGIISGFIGVMNSESVILGFLNIIQFMIGPLFSGGLLFLIANISKGEYPPHKDMLAQAMPFWATILFVSVITGLIIALGFVFMIIPGVWFMLRLYLAPVYVVFQNKSVPDAISAAFAESKDHLLPFFQTLIPFIIVGLVFVMFMMGQSQKPSLLSTTLITIGTTFGFIFSSIVQFRLYTVYIENQETDEEEIEKQVDED